ncbi:transcriptional regulator, HxlR family [Actinacidiphila alni]|uniref:Transcriptional regulator, HxlR family n=1 Tax=Actinacidiphila alni TaxID=380248 RepID=A0A1I2CKB2_9ACTN|nr:helix-turn-helix domain-containing protein [Actinacidiphila alni]SFE68741.1 transcriptional regulator, HxlR family [Actinacidiphila alni]
MDTNVTAGAGAGTRTAADTGAGGGVPLRAMADQPVGVRPCSLAAALEVVGERWSLLAVREMAYGVHRFARIAGYTGASRDILADRLRKLEAAGVVERRQYSEHPPRFEYHLTQAGHELFPAMLALLQWGDKWAVERPAVEFRHTCGERVAVEPVCAHCGDGVTRASLTPVRPSA